MWATVRCTTYNRRYAMRGTFLTQIELSNISTKANWANLKYIKMIKFFLDKHTLRTPLMSQEQWRNTEMSGSEKKTIGEANRSRRRCISCQLWCWHVISMILPIFHRIALNHHIWVWCANQCADATRKSSKAIGTLHRLMRLYRMHRVLLQHKKSR